MLLHVMSQHNPNFRITMTSSSQPKYIQFRQIPGSWGSNTNTAMDMGGLNIRTIMWGILLRKNENNLTSSQLRPSKHCPSVYGFSLTIEVIFHNIDTSLSQTAAIQLLGLIVAYGVCVYGCVYFCGCVCVCVCVFVCTHVFICVCTFVCM